MVYAVLLYEQLAERCLGLEYGGNASLISIVKDTHARKRNRRPHRPNPNHPFFASFLSSAVPSPVPPLTPFSTTGFCLPGYSM